MHSHSEVAIRAQSLGKAYRIYARPEDRLRQFLFGRWRQFYSEYWALQGISLEVHRGETVGVIGRNGAGKSTFLQLLCGTVTPTTGTVTTSGRVAALLELGAGFNPEFSGRENVFLAGAILGLSRNDMAARFAAIEEFAGIGDFIDQPVKLYSSGMYARLAFSVAAHVDADILIVDEILSVGDAAFAQKCYRFIRRFKERGTLFFVSHDTAAVTSLCDRAIWLENGQLRREGPAKIVCDEYLSSLYEENDGSRSFRIGGSRSSPLPQAVPVMDERRNILASSTRRNEIEIFEFNPEAPWFGQRGATIERVELLSATGDALPAFEGGENVTVRITCAAQVDVKEPIVGFMLRNGRGQNLFGDNTFLTYRDQVREPIPAGARFQGCFTFQLPFLPTGDYSITAAIAEGTQTDHIQHHWVDDALLFKVHSSHLTQGLVGIPMQKIALSVVR